MSFDSLERVIKEIEKQPGWEIQQQYRLLLQCWNSVVPPQAASHARPLYIARQILWVATSSSVWAQNLSMQRYSLLKKLNACSDFELSDIKFSPAKWHDRAPSPAGDVNSRALEQSDRTSSKDLTIEAKDARTAFGQWAEAIRHRLQNSPLCPRCQCATPERELQRWNTCAFCAAGQWSKER